MKIAKARTSLYMYKILLFLLVLISCSGETDGNLLHKSLPVSGKPITLIKITTPKKIKDEPKTEGQLQFFFKDSVVFSSNIGIEYRGAVSQQFYEKKSYGFELWDKNRNGISKELLGLPANEDWILHGPYSDKSLIRNVLAYKTSNAIGKYAPRTRYVELEVNGDYKGLYVLMEKIKRDKARVDVAKLRMETSSIDSISGGYILKIDKTAGGNSSGQSDYSSSNSFTSKYDQSGRLSNDSKIHFLFDYPKERNISEAQKKYITEYVHEFETAMTSPNFSDSNTGFRKFIDEQSFIEYFILTELFQNFDGYRISTYLQKQRNEKLKMGPIWDFDLSLGSRGFCYNMNKSGKNYWIFQYNNYCGDDMWVVPFWWRRLLEDRLFVEKLNVRWKELRRKELSEQSLMKSIDEEFVFLIVGGFSTKKLNLTTARDRMLMRFSKSRNG
jgi:hypothetical protein